MAGEPAKSMAGEVRGFLTCKGFPIISGIGEYGVQFGLVLVIVHTSTKRSGMSPSACKVDEYDIEGERAKSYEGPFGPNSRCCRQSGRIDCGRLGVFTNRLMKDADSPHL